VLGFKVSASHEMKDKREDKKAEERKDYSY
jgi:hypothetical protein